MSFLASLFNDDKKNALKYLIDSSKYNNSYLCFMLGIVMLKPEDYSQIFDLQYVEEESFEDAARNVFCLGKLIDENSDKLSDFIDEFGSDLIHTIDPGSKGMELLFVLEAKKEATLKEVVQAVKQLKDEIDFAGLKKLNEDQIRKELINLKNKKYLHYIESKYSMTFLGFCVLEFFVGDETNENNK